MSNQYSLSSLIHDYIDVFRGIQLEQGNAITTYLNSQREMNSSINSLLLRYLEIERTSRNFNPPPRPPSSIFSFNTHNNRAPSQSPINNMSNNPLNTPFSFNWPSRPSDNNLTSNLRNTTTPSTRSVSSLQPRDNPIPRTINTSRTRTRTRSRNRTRVPRISATTNIRATRIPRDVFQNFLNNTLNMGNIPQPLEPADISANVTNLIFSDLDENNNQTVCPFTQDNFQDNDEISRINPCGHIFTRSHLHRYLSNFDHRCPICRRDLRRENDIENPQPVTDLLDLSSNLNILQSNNNSQDTTSIINTAVESVTNALVNNLTNQLTNDPSRNSIVAEYSFFLPTNLTTNLTPNLTQTTNVTPNLTQTSTADDDIHDYLGLPPRNNSTQTLSSFPITLPPLPEDSENELPELIEHFSDDEDL